MKKVYLLCLTAALMIGKSALAVPLVGSYVIPGPKFGTLKSAIDSLNLLGASGPVTFNLTAGSVNETAPSGGYVIGSAVLNDPASPDRLTAAKNLTINGNNNILTAAAGTGNHDAIFTIRGTDYITINKLHLVESSGNTTATSMMEHGYSMVKTNNNDGCKNISINNCTITLNKANTTAASGVSHLGSAGVFIGNCTYTSTASLAVPTDYEGSHESIFIFGDSIRNVNQGIYGNGTGVVIDGIAFNDMNITIQSNTISNFTHNGIYLVYFNNDVVSGNKINNMWDGGAAPTANQINGIIYNGATVATNNSWTCEKNNVDLTVAGAGFAALGIYTQIIGTGTSLISTDTVKLTSTGASATLIGIYGQNGNGTCTIEKNMIHSFSNTATNTSNIAGIWNGRTSAPVGYPTTCKISDNLIANFNISAAANLFGCIDQNAVTTSTTPSIFTGNTIRDITLAGNSTAFKGYQFRQQNTSGVALSLTCTDNIFRDITATGTTPMTIIDPAANIYVESDLSKNRLQNIKAGTGFLTGVQLDYGKKATMTSDTFINMTGSADVIGYKIGFGGTSVSTVICNKNLLDSFSTSGTSNTVTGISATTGTSNFLTTATLTNSVIRRMIATGTSAVAAGMITAGGTTTYNINNNFFSEIKSANNVSAYSSTFGMNLQSTGTTNIYYNTVNLSPGYALETGYGATGLVFNPSGTNTIQNNFLRVNITAGSANNVSAIRGTSGAPNSAPALTGFTASSNIYYTPKGSNNFLYVDGTTNASLVNGFHQSGLTPNATKNIVNDTFFNSECDRSSYHKFMQTGAASREKKTFMEDTLVGSGGVYTPTTASYSYAESSATDGSVLLDFMSASRPFGASDIGALEFAGSIRPAMEITITSSTGLTEACIYNLPKLTGTIPSYFKRVSYQWYRDTSKIAGATTNSIVAGTVTTDYVLKVYDSVTGCEYASAPFRITIVPLPPAIITYYDSLVFCQTGAVVLQANKGKDYSYRWFRNGSLMGAETDDHYVAETSGDYTVEVNTPLGCPSLSIMVRVKVYPLPTPVVYYVRTRVLGVTQKYYSYQWYKNNVKINDTDALGPLYYVPDGGDGAYSVEVTDSNGCTAKSDVFLFSLGIKDAGVAANIKVYPNPVMDILNIESPIPVEVSVSDLAGRIVVAREETKTVKVGHLADGMYLLTLTDKEGNVIKVEKISKTK